MRSRVVAWLRVLLPLAALAILSTLFLLPKSHDPDAAIPYADVDADRMEMSRNADGQHVLNLTGSVRLVYQP